MSSPHRVRFVKQLDGSAYAGLNCNCAAGAMAVDRASIAAKRTSGARVRQLTGDKSGGTTLPQVDAALNAGFGVNLDVRLGSPFYILDDFLHAGKGAILQGAARATRGTRYQASETFGGNHSWWVNEGRGARLVNGHWTHSSYLVFDPLADGRRSGIAKSPFWIPRGYVEKFARLLDLTGDGRLLGPGKVYAGFTRDTEPHLHARYGGRATHPFPDRTRATAPAGRKVNVHSRPVTSSSTVVETLANDELFVAYQRTSSGEAFRGSRVWFGDHGGTRWVHEARLTHEGGTT